jgi:hypothetical protein
MRSANIPSCIESSWKLTLVQALSTVVLLDGTAQQLQTMYELKKEGLQAWSLSPGRISDMEDRARFLGDIRYVRESMETRGSVLGLS